MQFLQDEFVNIAQSDAFSFIPKKYLAEALKSDFLQVFNLSSACVPKEAVTSLLLVVVPIICCFYSTTKIIYYVKLLQE